MKPPAPDTLTHFLRAVHRRMTLLRAIERLGLSLLTGAAASLLLSPILIARDQSTGELSLVLLAITAATGIAWAAIRRTTPFAAAAEADRQLNLADLLSTAARLPTNPTDPFERSILALAQSRAAQLSPSALILHRLSARSWGGIALALTAVLTLALMTAQTPPARAAAASTTPKSWQDRQSEKPFAQPPNSRTPDYRRPKTGTGADDEDPLRSETPTPAALDARPPNTENGGTGTNTASDGAGTGSASSPAKPHTDDPAATATGNPHPSHSAAASTSTGGAGQAASTDTTQSPAGNNAHPSPDRRPSPVWRSETWTADQAAARSAIRDGKVPDRYRDLVRDYFERR